MLAMSQSIRTIYGKLPACTVLQLGWLPAQRETSNGSQEVVSE